MNVLEEKKAVVWLELQNCILGMMMNNFYQFNRAKFIMIFFKTNKFKLLLMLLFAGLSTGFQINTAEKDALSPSTLETSLVEKDMPAASTATSRKRSRSPEIGDAAAKQPAEKRFLVGKKIPKECLDIFEQYGIDPSSMTFAQAIEEFFIKVGIGKGSKVFRLECDKFLERMVHPEHYWKNLDPFWKDKFETNTEISEYLCSKEFKEECGFFNSKEIPTLHAVFILLHNFVGLGIIPLVVCSLKDKSAFIGTININTRSSTSFSYIALPVSYFGTLSDEGIIVGILHEFGHKKYDMIQGLSHYSDFVELISSELEIRANKQIRISIEQYYQKCGSDFIRRQQEEECFADLYSGKVARELQIDISQLNGSFRTGLEASRPGEIRLVYNQQELHSLLNNIQPSRFDYSTHPETGFRLNLLRYCFGTTSTPEERSEISITTLPKQPFKPLSVGFYEETAPFLPQKEEVNVQIGNKRCIEIFREFGIETEEQCFLSGIKSLLQAQSIASKTTVLVEQYHLIRSDHYQRLCLVPDTFWRKHFGGSEVLIPDCELEDFFGGAFQERREAVVFNTYDQIPALSLIFTCLASYLGVGEVPLLIFHDKTGIAKARSNIIVDCLLEKYHLYYICISEDIFINLNDEEIIALILHLLLHIRLGHVQPPHTSIRFNGIPLGTVVAEDAFSREKRNVSDQVILESCKVVDHCESLGIKGFGGLEASADMYAINTLIGLGICSSTMNNVMCKTPCCFYPENFFYKEATPEVIADRHRRVASVPLIGGSSPGVATTR
jgi:hypothetical protein